MTLDQLKTHAMKAAELDQAIRAVCPIHGFSGFDAEIGATSVKRIDFDGATEAQQAAAWEAVRGFNYQAKPELETKTVAARKYLKDNWDKLTPAEQALATLLGI